MTPVIRQYLEGRLFEWVVATNMTLLGIEMLLFPILTQAKSFIELTKILPGQLIAWFMVAFGLARIAALIANGRSTFYGPRVRSIGAIAGAVLWMQFTYSLIINFEDSRPSLGVTFWSVFVLAELYSAYRAETDART